VTGAVGEDRSEQAETVAAYQADAAAYASAVHLVDSVREELASFAARVGPVGRVLEVGSGGGRDARALEAAGLVVRRTDITPAFVEVMRADGFDADVLDPLVDDLGGPWDGVWTNAALLHVARPDLPVVLARLRAATRPGGTLYLSLKEGDGEAWSTHGDVRARRHFVYWRAGPLRAVVEGAGWRVDELRHVQGAREPWLEVFATAGEGTAP
jgi:2-polyprenyl-3-methyl-5-hydroxy-6-metoxy-1,4-benzoquinol methylase